MKLVFPEKKYELQYKKLVESAIKNNDASELGNAYRENETFDAMIKRLEKRKKGIELTSRDVSSTMYFMITDDGRLVGTIDLRHYLNDNYYSRLGHIAYYVKKEERNKGYATEALSLALEKYKEKGINEVLITCLKNNVASIKVIKKNNGKFEKEFYDQKTDNYIKRFWVNNGLKKIIKPSTVWLTTNTTCNNNCKWCYAKSFTKLKRNMQVDEVEKYVKVLKQTGVKKIILIGGEPSVHPDILQIIKIINDSGLKVSMATNARKFADYNFALKAVKNGLENINISIKGSSEKEYLESTNSYGLEEMLKGYKNLKSLGTNVSLSYVLCDTDYEKFDRFWNLVKKYNLNNIMFQLYKPSASDTENPVTIETLAEICKYVYDKIYKDDVNFIFEMSIPLCTLDENMLKHMIKTKRITTCCHISKGSGMIFDTDFNILPCNHFMGHPLNEKPVSLDSLIDFWNSKDVKEFRNIIKKYPSEICSRCSKWYFCGGGCMIRWLSNDPDEVINDKYVYDKEVS